MKAPTPRLALALLSCASLTACGPAPTIAPDAAVLDAAVATDAASEAGVADAPPDGTAIVYSPDHTFPAVNVPVGGEVLNVCQSWTVHNPEDLWVNGVTMDAGPGWHHSNWVFVPENQFVGPDGTWNCDDRNFSEAIAAAVGGVFFAQSTQATHENQQFAPGVAFRMPRHQRVIGSIHLINITPAALSSTLSFHINSIPAADVSVPLRPLAVDNRALNLVPRGRTQVSTSCDLTAAYRAVTGTGLDFSVYYALAHYHGTGRNMRVEAVGGPRDGAVIYQTSAGVGDPLGGMINAPFDLTGATGVRVLCSYQNPTDHAITWGVHSTDEMCTLLMYTNARAAFGGFSMDVAQTTTGTDGTVQESSQCTVAGLVPP